MNSSSSQLSLSDPVSARAARARALASIISLRILSCLEIVGMDCAVDEACEDLSIGTGSLTSTQPPLFWHFTPESEGRGRSHVFGRGGGLVLTVSLPSAGDIPRPDNDESSRLRLAPCVSSLLPSAEKAKEYANEFDESW